MDQTIGPKFVGSPLVVGVVCVENEAQSFPQLDAKAFKIPKCATATEDEAIVVVELLEVRVDSLGVHLLVLPFRVSGRDLESSAETIGSLLLASTRSKSHDSG
jgi:hypothetical protein